MTHETDPLTRDQLLIKKVVAKAAHDQIDGVEFGRLTGMCRAYLAYIAGPKTPKHLFQSTRESLKKFLDTVPVQAELLPTVRAAEAAIQTGKPWSTIRFCTNCGKPIRQEWAFCGFCGAKRAK